jgi:hypothetical protein
MVWWEGTAEIPGRIVELTDSMGARIASTAAHNQKYLGGLVVSGAAVPLDPVERAQDQSSAKTLKQSMG